MSTRRLPYYFLIDTSASPGGSIMVSCRDFFCAIVDTMRQDPFALETANLSVIKFGGEQKVVMPLVDLCSFYLQDGAFVPGCSLGSGLKQLAAAIRSDVVSSDAGVPGDWRPCVVLWLTAEPTDDLESGLRQLESIKMGRLFAVVAGSVAKTTTNRLKDAGFIVVYAVSGEDPLIRWREDVWKAQFDFSEADIDDPDDSSR